MFGVIWATATAVMELPVMAWNAHEMLVFKKVLFSKNLRQVVVW